MDTPGPKVSKFQVTPYIKGELSRPKNVSQVLTIVLFILFIVMEVANFSAFYTGIAKPTQVGAIWALLACFALYAENAVNARSKLHPFQLIGALLFLIGIPGLVLSNPGLQQTLFYVVYIFAMALRLVLVFIILPRIMMRSEKSPIHLVLNWMLLASFIACLVVIYDYTTLGFNIFNSARPGPGTGAKWINPNLAGFYATFAFYTAFLAERAKPILRLSSISVGFYLAMVSQSRNALFVIAISTVIYVALLILENPKKYSMRIVGWGTTGLVLLFTIFVVFKDLPMIQGLSRRFSSEDFTTGRDDFAVVALEIWRSSPLFGQGFTGIQIDNAYITFMLETGIVGLIIYLAVFGAILYNGWRHFLHGNQTEKILGKAIIVMGIAIFIRGFAENVSFMMITDLQSNAFCILAAISFLIPLRRPKTPVGAPA